jgi:hypothetical protein
MTISTVQNSLAQRLNAMMPGSMADQHRVIGFGDLVRRQRTELRRQNPNAFAAGVASVYNLATLQVLVLPDDAKAHTLVRVYARAGTGTKGELTPLSPNTTPAAHQPAVTPNGDIGFLATDAYTDVDIEYSPVDYDVVELTLPVVPGTGVCTIPAKYAGTAGAGTNASSLPNVSSYAGGAAGVALLMEAEALQGTTTGKKVVLAPAAAVPGTAGEASLDTTKSLVYFTIADAVTQARVKLGVFRSYDLNALLEAVSSDF